MKTGRPKGTTRGLGRPHTIRFESELDDLLGKTASVLGVDFTEVVRSCCRAIDLTAVMENRNRSKTPYLAELLTQHIHVTDRHEDHGP
jgi:hypothetical protein